MKSSMYSETTIFSINFDRINGCVLNICVRSFECSSYVSSSGIISFIKSSRMLLKYYVAAARSFSSILATSSPHPKWQHLSL